MTRWTFSSTGTEVVESFKDRVKGKTSISPPSLPQTASLTPYIKVLITGPSEGSIGAETALSLAAASPSTLILTGRSPSKINPVINTINSISPTTTVHFVSLDLSSQNSVRKAANEIEGLVEKIDILIHSAGIMVTPFEKSEDGVEGQFATNYLGGFLLVGLLMGRILKEGGGRVVLLSSSAHRMGGVRFGDVNFEVSEGNGQKDVKNANQV
jgi:NAD(P)-dependent dehydrogenase (short-subunit alcohol dehydrogenase family)